MAVARKLIIRSIVGLLLVLAVLIISVPPQKLSPAKPYSVMVIRVRNYDEARDLERRASFLDINPHPSEIVSLKENDGIWHEVHMGAEKSEEDALAIMAELEDAGMSPAGVRNYDDYEGRILDDRDSHEADLYHTLLRTSILTVPAMGDRVPGILASLPHVPGLDPEKLLLMDSGAGLTSSAVCARLLKKETLDLGIHPELLALLDRDTCVYGAASYRNQLLGTKAHLIVCRPAMSGEKPRLAFLARMRSGVTEQLQIASDWYRTEMMARTGKLMGHFTEIAAGPRKGTRVYLLAPENMDYAYLAWTAGMTREDSRFFLKATGDDESILAYRPVRRQFCLLPDESRRKDEGFHGFFLMRLTRECVLATRHPEWAGMLAGQWGACAVYGTTRGAVRYDYCDMDNSEQAHELFSNRYYSSYRANGFNGCDRIMIMGLPGLYVPRDEVMAAELNFNFERYVLTVSGNYRQKASCADLVPYAKALQIWKVKDYRPVNNHNHLKAGVLPASRH